MDALRALADPTRRRIVELLTERPRTAGELASAFDVSRPAVSRHLRVLREAGLASSEVHAQRRVYRLDPAPLGDVAAWLDRTRAFWTNRLDALEVELQRDDDRSDDAEDRPAPDCTICAKHRGEGPLGGQLVARLDGLWVYHAPPDDAGLAPLGYLFIESDRHAPYVSDLTDAEAAALGRVRTNLAASLRDALTLEHTFAMVVGRGVAHFHEHLVSRHRGTPEDVPWYRSHEAAPRADPGRVRGLVEELSRRLQGLP